MSKLKVLISAYACNPTPKVLHFPGEAILGWNLVEQVSRYNDVWVITHGINEPEINAKIAGRQHNGMRFIYIQLPTWVSVLLPKIFTRYYGARIYYWLWQINAYRMARKLVKHIGFDCSHQITFSNDWMPSYIGAYLDLPFIWGPIGGGQRVPNELRGELPFGIRQKEVFRGIFQWLWRRTPSRRRCIKRAKAILVCNKETRQKISAGKEKVMDFPVNGISPPEYQVEQDDREKREKFKIFYAGRLDAIKGIKLGIKAFNEFSKKNSDSALYIVGEGPEDREIKKLIRSLNLEDEVKQIPWLKRESLIKFMKTCDVLLFPSFRDGGGAVVVEAMACGCPIIALNIGGPGFHVKEDWGIKIEPKDPDKLMREIANALDKLSADRELLARMKNSAKARALSYYPWERLGMMIDDLYRRITEHHS